MIDVGSGASYVGGSVAIACHVTPKHSFSLKPVTLEASGIL